MWSKRSVVLLMLVGCTGTVPSGNRGTGGGSAGTGGAGGGDDGSGGAPIGGGDGGGPGPAGSGGRGGGGAAGMGGARTGGNGGGSGGARTGGSGGGLAGSSGTGGRGVGGNIGPAPGPGPGVTGGGQIGGGKMGGPGAPAVPAAGETSYWLQNTSLKVQPTTAPGPTGGGVAIEGARGATESYQIVLRGALGGVDATPTVLSDGAGNTIAAGNVAVFREAFVDFTGNKALGGTLPAPAKSPTGDGLVPDPLIPLHDPYTGDALGAPFDVAADRNQPMWIDVRIPIDQAVGTYTGAITFAATGKTITVPLSVTVWDVTLPDMRAIPTWFRIDYGYIEKYHAGVHDCYATRCAADSQPRKVIKRYEEMLHQHRLEPTQTLIPYPNGCNADIDFRDYDAALGPYMDGSYWEDSVPSSVVPSGFSPGQTSSSPQSCGHAAVTARARAFAAHMKAKGWWDRTYTYSEDEPDESHLPAIAEQAGWMVEGDIDWKSRIFVTTTASPSSAPILDPSIGIYVECLKCFDKWNYYNVNNYGRTEWAARLQQGFRLWFYESNAQGPPYSGLATNTLDAAEPRIMMWGSWYEGASGFLYWDVISWNDSAPWGVNADFNKTGDGVLVYPGDHSGTNTGKGLPAGIAMAGPVASVRLKMARSGMQDWALFLLADRNNLRDMAKSEVSKAYGQLGACDFNGCPKPLNGSYYWRTDYDIMQGARKAIVTALLASQK